MTAAPPREFLADDLLTAARQSFGAPEHDQIADLLGKAARYALDADVSAGLNATVVDRTLSIERNLDLLRPENPVTWIEWPRDADEPASMATGESPLVSSRTPERVGCLIAEIPDDPDRYITVAAWRFPDGSIHHSYAAMIWSMPHMAMLSLAARTYLSGQADESKTRLLAQAHVFVPTGLMAELDILCDDQRDLEDAVAAAQRDVTAEHLFLAAALLLLKTSDVAISDLTIPADSDTEHPGVQMVSLHGRRHGRGGLPAFAWIPRKRGFRRRSGRGTLLLSWEDPR